MQELLLNRSSILIFRSTKTINGACKAFYGTNYDNYDESTAWSQYDKKPDRFKLKLPNEIYNQDRHGFRNKYSASADDYKYQANSNYFRIRDESVDKRIMPISLSIYKQTCVEMRSCRENGLRYAAAARRLTFLLNAVLYHKDGQNFVANHCLDWWFHFEPILTSPSVVSVMECLYLLRAFFKLNVVVNSDLVKKLGAKSYVTLVGMALQERNALNMKPWLFSALLQQIGNMLEHEPGKSFFELPENLACLEQLRCAVQTAFSLFLRQRCLEPKAFVVETEHNKLHTRFHIICQTLTEIRVPLPPSDALRNQLAFVCHSLVCDDRLRRSSMSWDIVKRLTILAFVYDYWNFNPEVHGYQYWSTHFAVLADHMRCVSWTVSQNFQWLLLDVHLRLVLKFGLWPQFEAMKATWLLYFAAHCSKSDHAEEKAALRTFCQLHRLADEDILAAMHSSLIRDQNTVN